MVEASSKVLARLRNGDHLLIVVEWNLKNHCSFPINGGSDLVTLLSQSFEMLVHL